MKQAQLRKARIFMLSPSLWKKRLVFWTGAALVGIISSYFAIVSDETQHAFISFAKQYPYAPLIISPIAMGASVWLMLLFCPGISGSGIPQAIAARVMRDEKSRKFLLGPGVVVGKILLTLVAMLGGAAIGREGPTVQVGAALMVYFASLGALKMQRGAILAGTAAGVAAAFNTPLAGIVFAIEEMARAFEHRNSGIILTAIVISGVMSLAILGNYDYFGKAEMEFIMSRDWVAIITVGIIGGVIGAIFSKLVVAGIKFIGSLYRKGGLLYSVGFAMLCGLIIAVLGILTDGASYGTGYESAKGLLHGEHDASAWYPLTRFIATTVSAISGIPGGIFSPSLTVGAALGDSIASWFPNTPVQGVILLAMVAYFAGVTQAPITAFVIVLEVTGSATGAIPLIASGVIAKGVARVISPTSLYHSLAKLIIVRMRDDERLQENVEKEASSVPKKKK